MPCQPCRFDILGFCGYAYLDDNDLLFLVLSKLFLYADWLCLGELVIQSTIWCGASSKNSWNLPIELNTIFAFVAYLTLRPMPS